LGPASAAQRPGFNPRTSSLSLNSNDSTTSLLASSRRPNGSGLKESVTVLDTPDPLDVLEKLLGLEGKNSAEASGPTGVANGNKAAQDDFEYELDFGGLTLRELAAREPAYSQENHVSTQTIEECMFYPNFVTAPIANAMISRARESQIRRPSSINTCL